MVNTLRTSVARDAFKKLYRTSRRYPRGRSSCVSAAIAMVGTYIASRRSEGPRGEVKTRQVVGSFWYLGTVSLSPTKGHGT